MKTESIKSYNPQFKALKIRPGDLCNQDIADKILSSPAIKKFGKKFDAELNVQMYASSRREKVNYYGILFSDVQPATLFGKFLSLFKPKRYTAIHYNSGEETVPGFLELLQKLKKNTIIDIYNRIR